MNVRFLSRENIQQIHADTLAHEGGRTGTRDPNLLESALAMPSAEMFGTYLHEGFPAMAAAYLFHLSQNHSFFDGNKRVASFSSVIFLLVNGVPEDKLPTENELERVTLAVASSTMTKDELTDWFSRTVVK